MMHKKLIILLFFFFLITGFADQGTAQSNNPVVDLSVEINQYGWFQAHDFLNCEMLLINLTNLTDQDHQLLFNIRVSSVNFGEILNESTTEPFLLAAHQTVHYSNVSYPNLDTTFDGLPDVVYTDQTLNADTYTIIGTVYRDGFGLNDPQGDTKTVFFTITNPLPPVLISPGDGANLDNPSVLRPGQQESFSWSAIDPTGTQENYSRYVFTVVERYNEEPLESALNNPPIYTENLPGNIFNVIFPTNNEILELGKEYVWQVKAMLQNCSGEEITLSSTPWLFSYGFDAPVITNIPDEVSTENIDIEFLITGQYDLIELKVSQNPDFYVDVNGAVQFTSELMSYQVSSRFFTLECNQMIPGERYYLLAQLKSFDNSPLSLPSELVSFEFIGVFQPPASDDNSIRNFNQRLRELANEFERQGYPEIANVLINIVDNNWLMLGSPSERNQKLNELRELLHFLQNQSSHINVSIEW